MKAKIGNQADKNEKVEDERAALEHFENAFYMHKQQS